MQKYLPRCLQNTNFVESFKIAQVDWRLIVMITVVPPPFLFSIVQGGVIVVTGPFHAQKCEETGNFDTSPQATAID